MNHGGLLYFHYEPEYMDFLGGRLLLPRMSDQDDMDYGKYLINRILFYKNTG